MDEQPKSLFPSPIKAAIAASVLAHLALVGVLLLLAEVRPFADVPEQRIEVDIVTADEAPPVPAPKPEPEPETKPKPELPEFKPTLETTPAAQQPQSKPEQPKAQTAKPEPAKKQADTTKPDVGKPDPQKPDAAPQQQAAAPAETQQAQPQHPQEQTPQPQPQQATPTPLPPAIAQEPDLTVKYSVALGLPADPTFDGPAETIADISAEAVAALRRRLKSCATLPPPLTRFDNVKIVLRVALQPDGGLAQEPILIEASASSKGPALMKGAMDALAACQPYTMLPPDKYQEWKVLDIGFTPQDFRGG